MADSSVFDVVISLQQKVSEREKHRDEVYQLLTPGKEWCQCQYQKHPLQPQTADEDLAESEPGLC